MNLDSLGMTSDETALYLDLIDRPAVTAPNLASTWRSPSGSTATEVLAALEAKGLVTTLAGQPIRYAAVSPDVALDNLARVREREIAEARSLAGELTERWRRAARATAPGELVEIVVGREATLQRSEQIQRTAAEVLIVDAPPYAADVLGNPLESQLLREGATTYRCLYDRTALAVDGKWASIRALTDEGEQARVIADLPLKMVMGDRRIAMLPLETAPESITAAVLVHPSSLLDSLRLLFDTMWHRATPLARTGSSTELAAVDHSSTAVAQDLVRLLVTGLTDKAIGRQLGLAERTVQRHVRRLMQDYGVRNRLQLGMRLAETAVATREA